MEVWQVSKFFPSSSKTFSFLLCPFHCFSPLVWFWINLSFQKKKKEKKNTSNSIACTGFLVRKNDFPSLTRKVWIKAYDRVCSRLEHIYSEKREKAKNKNATHWFYQQRPQVGVRWVTVIRPWVPLHTTIEWALTSAIRKFNTNMWNCHIIKLFPPSFSFKKST